MSGSCFVSKVITTFKNFQVCSYIILVVRLKRAVLINRLFWRHQAISMKMSNLTMRWLTWFWIIDLFRFNPFLHGKPLFWKKKKFKTAYNTIGDINVSVIILSLRVEIFLYFSFSKFVAPHVVVIYKIRAFDEFTSNRRCLYRKRWNRFGRNLN